MVDGQAQGKWMRGSLTTLVLTLMASSAMPALACSIPPPPPPPVLAGASPVDQTASDRAWNDAHYKLRQEEDRAWKLRQQVRLFDEAGSIGVFRYDRESKVSGLPKEFDYMNGDPTSILKPVRWVKGKGSPAELTLGRGLAPPCGQIPAHDAFYGKPGEVFVIFLGADGHVLDGFKFESIVEPRTLAALTAR
jgi:hypothetical protein